MSSLVSIIIPIYNTSAYLRECLDSVLHQSYQDLEVICVNDGSPDNSHEILEEYAQRDHRIRIIHQENAGLSAARNSGMDAAQGVYITFVDSDDAIPQGAIELFVRMLEESGSLIAVSTGFTNYPDKAQVNRGAIWKKYMHPLPDLFKMRQSYSSAWNKMFTADILREIRFIDGLYFEDWPFITSLFSDAENFVSTAEKLYSYRQTEQSIVRSGFSQAKLLSFIKGIRYVYGYKDSVEYRRQIKWRNMKALQMCINKTYRDKAKWGELVPCLRRELRQLKTDNIISVYSLPIKTMLRYWKMLRHNG